MAAGAEAPELSGEAGQELVAALRAARPGDTVVDDAAVEVAVDRLLNAAPKVAVSPLESLLVDEEEALEVVGERPVEQPTRGRRCCLGSGRLVLCTKNSGRFAAAFHTPHGIHR